jgi:hypothetical protein
MLSHRIGGPSVYPPQPEGVYAFTQLNKDWKPSEGADRYRRGLYTYFWRSAPHPGLMAFDAPDGNTTCTRRVRSNTPLQALTLLNDKAYFELAQSLARRCLTECTDEGKRLDYLFRVCLTREPADRERKALSRLLERQRQSLENATLSEIEAVLGNEKLANPRQAAAWTMLARVLLNLDEFITRE